MTTTSGMLTEIVRSMIEEEQLDNATILDWLHSTAAIVRYGVCDVPDLENDLLNVIRVLLKGESE